MLERSTAPVLSALTIDEAKSHLRVEHNDEDADIQAMIFDATEEAEGIMQRAVMPQKFRLSLDEFPEMIVVRHGGLSAVDSVTYYDATNTQQTLSASAYMAHCSDMLARVVPVDSWPDTYKRPGAVSVVFSAGYANADAVPGNIKRWLKLRVGAFHENREAWTLGRAIERNEFIDSLLDKHRVYPI